MKLTQKATKEAEYGMDMYVWMKANRRVIQEVTVYRNANGGADVKIESRREYAEETWASYEVAKTYFGPPHGAHGTRVLRGVHVQHILGDGAVEYDGALGRK